MGQLDSNVQRPTVAQRGAVRRGGDGAPHGLVDEPGKRGQRVPFPSADAALLVVVRQRLRRKAIVAAVVVVVVVVVLCKVIQEVAVQVELYQFGSKLRNWFPTFHVQGLEPGAFKLWVNWIQQLYPAVALQVAFERQILKPVFHLIVFRLWV
jgi:hypothetical protein